MSKFDYKLAIGEEVSKENLDWGKGAGSGYGGIGSYNLSNCVPAKPAEKPRRARGWRDNNYWFIGDIHSNIGEYLALVNNIRANDPDAITIQVGDLELGDNKLPKMGPKDFFIQGNHDNIKACMKHPNFLGKFGFKNGVFFMGGAASNKWGYEHEELTDTELEAAIKLFKKTKPEIVVTHDCPQSIADELFWKKNNSRTKEALEIMWKDHNPHVWAFGHYHMATDKVIDGCQFLCVEPMEAQQIRLGWNLGTNEYKNPSKPTRMTKEKVINHFINSINPFK